MVLLVSAALGLLALQNPDPPHPKYKVEFSLRLQERDGLHVFLVQGKTDIPEGIVLKARIYAVTTVEGFNGPRVDEEPLVWEDDETQAAYRVLEHERGLFKEDVYRFVLPPWPLTYRARVIYDPRGQSEDGVKLLGDDGRSWHADLRVGDDAAFAAMLAQRVREVTDDLIGLKKDFDELRATFRKHDGKPDLAAWSAWKDAWYERVERRAERNKLRYGFWAVWLERQARMRVGALSDLLRLLLVGCTEHLKGEPKSQRLRETMRGWVQQWEEAADLIGIDLPLDLDEVSPPMAAYDKALEALREAMAKGDPELLSVARRDGLNALLRLPPMLRIRKRGYVIASELTRRFTALLEAVEAKAPAEALRAAVEEHESALRAFRAYAGLPAASAK